MTRDDPDRECRSSSLGTELIPEHHCGLTSLYRKSSAALVVPSHENELGFVSAPQLHATIARCCHKSAATQVTSRHACQGRR